MLKRLSAGELQQKQDWGPDIQSNGRLAPISILPLLDFCQQLEAAFGKKSAYRLQKAAELAKCEFAL